MGAGGWGQGHRAQGWGHGGWGSGGGKRRFRDAQEREAVPGKHGKYFDPSVHEYSRVSPGKNKNYKHMMEETGGARVSQIQDRETTKLKTYINEHG